MNTATYQDMACNSLSPPPPLRAVPDAMHVSHNAYIHVYKRRGLFSPLIDSPSSDKITSDFAYIFQVPLRYNPTMNNKPATTGTSNTGAGFLSFNR